MDMSSPTPNPNPWFTQLEVEDPMLLQEFVGDCLIDYPPEDMAGVMGMGMGMGMGMEIEMDDKFNHSLSPISECNSTTATADQICNSAKRQKPNNYALSPSRSSGANKSQSFSSLDSNSNSNSNSNDNNNNNVESTHKSSVQLGTGGSGLQNSDHECGGTTSTTKKPKRQPDQCHNHIIAERQRRQNLSQRFIALSALIPGLKKMDKTSVLGEAIDHMKQLKERVKTLEEENARRAVESVVVVKRSQVIDEDESNSSDNHNPVTTTISHNEELPEIEARFSNKSVLIKIHCQIQKGILTRVITQIENFHLSIASTTSMPFNGTTLDITIIAQMEPEFDMTPRDVVKDLRSIFE